MRKLVAMTAMTVVLSLSAAVRADVTPHPLFSDNCVLQQGGKVPVWGTADDGEAVTVSINGQEVKTTAKDGKWMVALDALKVGGPYELTIAGKNKLTLKNVLVGEVWICGGQSNMQWTVMQGETPKEIAGKAANPNLRLFNVKRQGAPKPADTVPVDAKQNLGLWLECNPETVLSFSAVGYHFGRNLNKALDVPVGLINSNVGGTAAERWTRQEVLNKLPGFENAKGGDLYNAMIAPLAPYAVQGAIWYQGESNTGAAYKYQTLFSGMIQNWRDDWKREMPFLFVQLAPFGNLNNMNDKERVFYAELREAQLKTMQSLPKTAMAVITDYGHETNIHPTPKEPVGERLALAAQGVAYGKKVEYSGPIYDKAEIKDGKVILSFKHVGKGLEAKGGPLVGFTVCGEDRKFVKAEAEIKDDKVIVWSKDVEKPVAARYGWANYMAGLNLYNKDGLPATPFRTDDFPLLTDPKTPKPAASE